MANTCLNCGKEFSFLQKPSKLKYTRAEFCSRCAESVDKLLFDVRKNVWKRTNVLGTEFEAKLTESSFNEASRKIIEKEFDELLCDRPGSEIVKSFQMDFDECYKLVRNAAREAVGRRETDPEEDFISVQNVKVVSFVYGTPDAFDARNYSSLCVTLIYCNGEATVSAKAVGEMLGNAGGSVRSFWHIIRRNCSGIQITPVRSGKQG